MKTIAVILLTMWMAAFTEGAETANVAIMIEGRRSQLASDAAAQVTQRAVALLASCAYMAVDPKYGATSSQPESIGDVEKQSHLHLVFSSPVRVEVPIEKVTLRVREMVISLPLKIGGIWARTDNGVQYLSKFSCSASEELQKQLDKDVKP